MAIQYINPVFRPPSEAHSLILPISNGCSWNKCTFCEMYTAPQKKFYAHSEESLLNSIRNIDEQTSATIRRIFLADGDALALPTARLLKILNTIRTHFPSVQRISSYCLPRNLRKKSLSELIELHEAGLKLVYVGAESGDDFILERINKGETYASTCDALQKLAHAGIKRSVMILNGLGGRNFAEKHALHSAKLANETQPEFLSTLVLSLNSGGNRFKTAFPEWVECRQIDLFHEMESFVNALMLQNTIFRSDHASNWLVLKGTLGAEKEKLLYQIRQAISQPENACLRPAWARGL